MSFLCELQNCSQSNLRRTTTRVTNLIGQIFFESKSNDGTFEVSGCSPEVNPIFMEIYNSLDTKLHHVIESIYIGSQHSATNLTRLNEHKITHILNVAAEVKNAFPEQYKYFNIKLFDRPQTNIRQVFSHTNEFIQQAIAENGRILVHCDFGISRSSTIILAYLLGVHRMPYEAAFDLLKATRPFIKIHVEFIQQLKEYSTEILTC